MRPGEQNKDQRKKALQTRGERRDQKRAEAAATVEALLADAGAVPGYAMAHAAKARQGKATNLVALKCLECSGWQKTEVAACPVRTCPLYPLRPYRENEPTTTTERIEAPA
jgi:hypothetical protein